MADANAPENLPQSDAPAAATPAAPVTPAATPVATAPPAAPAAPAVKAAATAAAPPTAAAVAEPEAPAAPKVKPKKATQRACDEKDAKGKLCCGHLKRWYDYPKEIEALVGAKAEVYRCEFCQTIYKPDLSKTPHSYTLRY
jgi:hypothetical protein